MEGPPHLSGMKEMFLHHVWESLKFKTSSLRTREGEEVGVIHPGQHNFDQGPDFFNAMITVSGIEFFGHVELHVHSEDWYLHGHHRDSNYNSVVLHVVYESGQEPIHREDGTIIPEVSLKGLIDTEQLLRMEKFVNTNKSLPCEGMVKDLPAPIVGNWLDRLGVERLQEKIMTAEKRLATTTHNWEQVLWEDIAGILGGPVNGEAFRELAREVPFRLIRKYANCQHKVEALLYGVSGLLKGSRERERYQEYLSAEWGFLSMKYNLGFCRIPLKFLRMRPAGFPTVRISQLANLVNKFSCLSDLLKEGGIEKLLKAKISAGLYWETHYHFGKTGQPGIKSLGKSLKETLVMNSLLPLSYLYQKAHGRKTTGEIQANHLERMRPENNQIVRSFDEVGITAENALRTQGLVRLKKVYCGPQNCLSCAIGSSILNRIETCKLTL